MNKYLFDTHSHLDLLENFDLAVKEIEEKKIYTIAVTNLPVLYEKLSKKINSKYIKPALGFHPELIGQYQKYIPDMWRLLPDARYIGEVGLDYNVGISSKQIQISFFEELIERCNDLGNKILTIHSRSSAEDVVSIIGNNFNSKFILHWYSGSLTTLNKAIYNNAYFSINYAMVNSENGKRIIANIPINRLLLESDAPFVMYDKNVFFKTTDIEIIVRKLSIQKQIELEEMKLILWSNFKSIL